MAHPIRQGIVVPGRGSPPKLALAKAFRAAPTPEEAQGWEWVRRGGIDGWRVRRQQVIRGFIVDFFCARLSLVIEFDGAVHDRDDVAAYDASRDALLGAAGLAVVRLPNNHTTRERLEEVFRARAAELGLTPPLPPGRGGRGERQKHPQGERSGVRVRVRRRTPMTAEKIPRSARDDRVRRVGPLISSSPPPARSPS